MSKEAAPKKAAPSQTKKGHLYAGGVAPYYLLLIAVTLLVGISAVMVISASSNEAVSKLISAQSEQVTAGTSTTLATFGKTGLAPYMNGIRNIAFILVGIACAWALSRSNYRQWGAGIVWPVVGTIVLLVLTVFFGTKVNGARRWLDVGVSIQASELAKPVLLAYVAWLFSHYRLFTRQQRTHWTDYWPWALVVGCGLLIYTQPDLGTTAIIIAGCVVGYLATGGQTRWLAAIFPAGAVGVLAFIMMSGNYQAGRITSFLSGEPSHQVKQALYALGSGGLIGLGPGLSRQKYHNLPEAQNDFILAIIGEELGFVGAIMIVLGFALILYAGIRISMGCKDKMGRALGAGATTMLVFQGIINMAAVVGVGPVTGKPLPFVTLGGSAMISAFLLLGILLSVSRFGGDPCRPELRPQGAKPSRKQRPSQSGKGHSTTKKTSGHDKSLRRPKSPEINPTDEGQHDDEDSIEWRWDSGAHLSRDRSRS